MCCEKTMAGLGRFFDKIVPKAKLVVKKAAGKAGKKLTDISK